MNKINSLILWTFQIKFTDINFLNKHNNWSLLLEMKTIHRHHIDLTKILTSKFSFYNNFMKKIKITIYNSPLLIDNLISIKRIRFHFKWDNLKKDPFVYIPVKSL